MFSLINKTAIITGGGSGIGEAIAHALSDAGARLILVGRNEETLKRALGGRDGIFIGQDICAKNAADDLHAQCVDRGMLPDIIVNAAGVTFRQQASDVTTQSWHDTLYLNLTMPFFIARAFQPHMKKQGWGRVINIASLQSSRAFSGGIAYGASKGGVAQLTRAMAESWSKDGINCNAIAPGFFPTNLTKILFNDAEKQKKLAEQTAIGRNGELDDLKGPAVFFASDASKYVTGQILYVDGGFTAK